MVTKQEMKRAVDYIESQTWKFAKTMPHWPHWYIVRDKVEGKREVDFIVKLIEREGYDDPWSKTVTFRYLDIETKDGIFKYWWDDPILNRGAVKSNAKVREEGIEYAKHNKMPKPYWMRG